ncbi:MAG: hypothetical protein ACRD3N_01115, partial [Terracidiphilus sp.]
KSCLAADRHWSRSSRDALCRALEKPNNPVVQLYSGHYTSGLNPSASTAAGSGTDLRFSSIATP